MKSMRKTGGKHSMSSFMDFEKKQKKENNDCYFFDNVSKIKALKGLKSFLHFSEIC